MLERIFLGALIIGFLIAEPDGLAALSAARRRTVSPVACVRKPRRQRAKFNAATWSPVMTFGFRLIHLALASAIALGGLSAAPAVSLADEQYFPLQSYRVGPYAAGGTGFFGGFIDYMNLINIRDGGVNGVKLIWDECETQYEVERGVEVLRAPEGRTPGAAGLEPALGRHRLRDDRPHYRRQGAVDHDQPRPHRFHRRTRLSLCLSAAPQPVQRDVGHHQIHRRSARAASTI